MNTFMIDECNVWMFACAELGKKKKKERSRKELSKMFYHGNFTMQNSMHDYHAKNFRSKWCFI